MMGKDETNEGGDTKTGKSMKSSKLSRKTVLGSNTLALFITPSCVNDQITPLSRGQVSNSFGQGSCSPFTLFKMLKEVNKYMVKGTKLYESLKELRLCGWVSPYTLLLTGPAEDMKVIKHAWMKRYLKSPLGYFIKDIGIVQEFVVELLPQSPFISLKTALFDAVADLNNQSIFPSKENLCEYLKKHYPEIKLPEIKHVHECLGRLVKKRRLYHNGCGYFILCNVNVLNELKLFNNEIPDSHSSAESTIIKGFALSSSGSPGVTDLEVISCNLNTSNSAELSTSERGFPSSLESNRNNVNPVKSFFKKHGKLVKKQGLNEETVKTQVFDKCIGVLDINAIQSEHLEGKGKTCNISPVLLKHENNNIAPSCIKHEKVGSQNGNKCKNEKLNVNKREHLHKPFVSKHESKEKGFCNDTKGDDIVPSSRNKENDEIVQYSKNKNKNNDEIVPCSKNKNKNNGEIVSCSSHVNEVIPHLNKHDNEGQLKVESICGKVTNDSKNVLSYSIVTKRKSKIKRSQSFDGKVGKIQKDVTFAIVGVPCNPTSDKCDDKTSELSYFKRSHSFGAGTSRKFHKRPQDDTYIKAEYDDHDVAIQTVTKSSDSSIDPGDTQPVFYHGITIYDDDNSSSNQENNFPGTTSLGHPHELLYNYENLGSALSFHKNNHAEYTVNDLSSPPVSTSLAVELKEVCNVKR